MFKLTNYIGGQFVEPHSKRYLDSFQPSTGKVHININELSFEKKTFRHTRAQQVIGSVPDSDEQDVDAAVRAALAAKDSWAGSTRDFRCAILLRVADMLEARLEEFGSHIC